MSEHLQCYTRLPDKLDRILEPQYPRFLTVEGSEVSISGEVQIFGLALIRDSPEPSLEARRGLD